MGDEDIARALLAACKGSPEPVLNTYEQLLSNGAILPSPNLRLRLLRSVLVVLSEWVMSFFAQRIGTNASGASLILGGTFSSNQTTVINQGFRDKITSAANRSNRYNLSSSLSPFFLFSFSPSLFPFPSFFVLLMFYDRMIIDIMYLLIIGCYSS